MIEIVNKSKCTGCGACLACCNVKAIAFTEDKEGFRYPTVNLDICLNCGLCNRVCPILSDDHGIQKRNVGFATSFYAGQLIKVSDLFEVSSGGAFWAFAQTILDKKGIVYGAIQEDVEHVFHIRADNIDRAKKIRRSKYFQSDVGDAYNLAKQDLENGKLVLFSGTACQIAGLNKFLGKTYENLFTCDVVCHGVPSMMVWRSYRKEKEQKKQKNIVDLIFRDKSKGWSKNQYKITYSDGSIEKERSTQQSFHAGYLQGYFYRPSCGKCKFASLPRVSDITLADYWLYEGQLLKRNGDSGVSLIVVNNAHVNGLLEETREYLNIEPTSKKLALKSCKHLATPPFENQDRAKFFELLEKKGYHAAKKRYIKVEKENNLVRKVYNKILAGVVKYGKI